MKRVSPIADTATAPPEDGSNTDASVRATARRAHLEETAAALGRTWAEERRRDLHREGRAAAGGWPGTLREARSFVGSALLSNTQGRTRDTITEAERELAVRKMYASARAEWRRHVDPDEP